MSRSLPERPKFLTLPTMPTTAGLNPRDLSSTKPSSRPVTSITRSIPASTFPQFSLLPTELRLQIYAYMLSLSTSPLPAHTHTTRILKLTFSPSSGRYISNSPPPPTLSLCAESRELNLAKSWEWLLLGPNFYCPPSASIPVVFGDTCVYISGILSGAMFTSSFLYHLSSSLSRHKITSLALDLRIFPELSENGLLGVLAGMKSLREVFMVVEFGRREFEGELGFLEMPAWRSDLKWVAENAKERLKVERRRGRSLIADKGEIEEGKQKGDVDVRCVLLTRGGEHA